MIKSVLRSILLILFVFSIGACSKKTTTPAATENTQKTKGERPQRGQRGGGRAPQFSNLLSRMDKDSDGKLSQTEVQGQMKENFSKIDQNGDGFITETEFKNAPRPPRRGGRGN